MDNLNNESKGMFLEINPNIDEIVKEQEELDEDPDMEERKAVIKEEKYDDEDVFEPSKPKPKHKPKPKPKQAPEPPPKASQGGATPHATPEKEHMKGLPPTWRERQKIEKEKKKAEEKERKEQERELRRFETAERNRQKARERYWTEKEKNPPKEGLRPLATHKPELKQAPEPKPSNDMDFERFTKYMMTYEKMKKQISQEKEDEMKSNTPLQPHNPFPPNYPAHLLYGNRKKKNNIFF
jgi:hypothetical protein